MERNLIAAGTGHRPSKCEDEGVVRIKARVKLEYSPVKVFICGMAAGFDLWAADEARALGLEVWAAKPWAGHGPVKGDEDLYATIESYASKVVNVVDDEDFPGAWCYHKRNEWMVDNANVVMAYWDMTENGGTYACIKYAKKAGKPVTNIRMDPPF